MPKLALHPAESSSASHPTLKAEIRVLFEKIERPLGEFEVWTHFAHRKNAPRPALVNAILFTLTDEGILRRFHQPGKRPFLDRGENVYSLASPAKGGAR